MPRKNQKRKNANSQSGRRKPKPIKFNPADIENEQNSHRSTADDDDVAVDGEELVQELEHYQNEEIEPENGSATQKKDDDDDDDDDKSSNQVILNSELNENEINRTNQMNTDDVQNDVNTTIPVAYTDSIANSTFNCKNSFILLYIPFFFLLH